MAFVQIMSYTTTKRDEMDAATRRWVTDTEEVRRVRRRLLLRERGTDDRFVEVLFFDSYEDAMHNSFLPATAVLASEADRLTEDGLSFRDLELVLDGF
jgi:hypothetical protein